MKYFTAIMPKKNIMLSNNESMSTKLLNDRILPNNCAVIVEIFLKRSVRLC